jgi:hypothetical protein
MPPQATAREFVVCLGLAAAALILTGCQLVGADEPLASRAGSTSTADEPVVRPGEFDDAGGRPCPQKLPSGDDPSGHGFGNQELANELPTLLKPEQAWVCQYNTFDVGTTPNGGTIFGWGRTGQPEPVAAADLHNFRAAVDSLALADRSGGCTDDLGPRWMVVFSHGGDLTGVVVDDYGCQDVRLTDNPHTTLPGANDQQGTVGGVLNGGFAILDAVRVDPSR